MYGKIRDKDYESVKIIVQLLKAHELEVGLHGPVLWDENYPSISMAVFGMGRRAQPADFLDVIDHLVEIMHANILEKKEDKDIGFDYKLAINGTEIRMHYLYLIP